MSNFKGCVPYVGAIIERQTDDGAIELLVQTRWTPKYPSIYNGTIEFAAGKLDAEYENVYDAIKREILEETGLKVTRFINQDKTKVYSPNISDASFGFIPYCCTQQLKDGRPWVGFIFRCEVENATPRDLEGESKDVRWMPAADLFSIFRTTPEKLFTLELPAWEYYFKDLNLL